MIPFRGLRLWMMLPISLYLVRHLSAGHSKMHESASSFESVDQLLDTFHSSEGDTRDNVLSLLTRRVKERNVTEREANIIKDFMIFAHDSKAKELWELIDTMYGSSTIDELLMGASGTYLRSIENGQKAEPLYMHTDVGEYSNAENNAKAEQLMHTGVGEYSKDVMKLEIENRTYVIQELDILIPEEEMESKKKMKRRRGKRKKKQRKKNKKMGKRGKRKKKQRKQMQKRKRQQQRRARSRRVKRKAVTEREHLWENGNIRYLIENGSFTPSQQYLIANAMAFWTLYTCVKFEEKNPTDSKSWLSIHRNGQGCYSFVGKQSTQKQDLVLGHDACFRLKTIIHELGHTIGLYHEHNRSDRDAYVEIKLENVRAKTERNFEKMATRNLVPYDYKSIMHYGSLFFSKDRVAKLKTIITKNASFQEVIGEAEMASFDDIKTVSLLYNCAGGCMRKPCRDDGFQGRDCKCWCRGSSSDRPVVLCATCSPPDIDLNIYQVWPDGMNETLKDFNSDTPNGTMFIVDFKDPNCGDEFTTIQCLHGEWNLTLPRCKASCVIESNLTKNYNIDVKSPNYEDYEDYEYEDYEDYEYEDYEDYPKPNTRVEHDTILKITCSSKPELTSSLTCENGTWTGLPPSCPQGTCPDLWKEKLKQMFYDKRDERIKIGPAQFLVQRTCNRHYAEYAVLVKILYRGDRNVEQKYSEVTAQVIKVFNQGKERQRYDMLMHFFLRKDCKWPELFIGKKYYIIARDGISYTDEAGHYKFKYYIREGDIVLQWKPVHTPTGRFMIRGYERYWEVSQCRK